MSQSRRANNIRFGRTFRFAIDDKGAEVIAAATHRRGRR
jgi:hypothetical protein